MPPPPLQQHLTHETNNDKHTYLDYLPETQHVPADNLLFQFSHLFSIVSLPFFHFLSSPFLSLVSYSAPRQDVTMYSPSVLYPSQLFFSSGEAFKCKTYISIFYY